MSLYRKCGLLSGAVLLCLATLSTGSAAAEPVVQSTPVRFDRAELATPQGVKKLYWRLQLAARMVCHLSDIRDLSQNAPYRACYEDAIDKAVNEVASPELTEFHRSRMQHPATPTLLRAGTQPWAGDTRDPARR